MANGLHPRDTAEFSGTTAALRRFRWRLIAVNLEELRPMVSETTFAAFRLTAIDGLSGEEAAERFGITRAAVYLTRARVLARLRERIEQYLDDGPDEATSDLWPEAAGGEVPT